MGPTPASPAPASPAPASPAPASPAGAPVFTSELLGSVDRSRSGVAAGTLNTLRQAGSAIGVALFGALVSHRFIAGAHLACGIGAGLAAGIVALTPLMRAG